VEEVSGGQSLNRIRDVIEKDLDESSRNENDTQEGNKMIEFYI
jgi:hypothetical protein